MSVNPRIYSKCLTADENRSFSYLVTNENAVLACGVTTKGKIITLERLGGAYCLKLYCLTTNSQKWERILEKDTRVLQYSNINIFITNHEKHAFELIDRDESIKLYEKIRGCIKKLSSSGISNPAGGGIEPSRLKQKPDRPPPTYRTSINPKLQSNILTLPSVVVDDLVDVSQPISTIRSDINVITNAVRKPSPKIKYPKERRNPNTSPIANSNISSPVLNDRRHPHVPPLTNKSPITNRNLAESSEVLTASPRKNPPQYFASPTSPVLDGRVPIQDVGIPIVNIGRLPRNQNYINATANTVLTSTENSLDSRNINLNNGLNYNNGNSAVRSPQLSRNNTDVVNDTNTSVNIDQNGSNVNPSSSINAITSGSTSSILIDNINPNGSVEISADNASGTNNNGNSLILMDSSNLASHQNGTTSSPCLINRSLATNIGNTSNFSNTTNLNINPSTLISNNSSQNHLAVNNSNNNAGVQSPSISNRRIPMDSTNAAARLANSNPSNVIPAQVPRKTVRTANRARIQYKTRSVFIQPTSLVSDIIVQFKSKLFTKEEEKTTPKCIVIGKPTNVTHQIHLDSLDFRNMQLHDTQLKGLIKSKSMENLSSISDSSLKVFDLNEEGPTCVICLTDPPTHVIVPCGHKILCEACVEQNVLGKLRRKWCMTCNGIIREIIKVYD